MQGRILATRLKDVPLALPVLFSIGDLMKFLHWQSQWHTLNSQFVVDFVRLSLTYDFLSAAQSVSTFARNADMPSSGSPVG